MRELTQRMLIMPQPTVDHLENISYHSPAMRYCFAPSRLRASSPQEQASHASAQFQTGRAQCGPRSG